MDFPWPLRMILLLSILSVISSGYLSTHLIKITKRKKRSAITITLAGFTLLFLVLAFIYPLSGVIIEVSGGSFDYDAFPRWMIFSFWYGLAAGVTMTNFLLLADFSSLFSRFFFKIGLEERLMWKQRGILLALPLVLIYVGATMYEDTRRITTEYSTVSLSDSAVPSAFSDSLRIIHISDIQADRFTTPEKMSRYITKVNETRPDIVVFTGDLVTDGTDYFDEGADALAQINAASGIYSVMGDHDFWSSPELYRSSLKHANSRLLEDTVIQIQHENLTIALAGITEIYSQKIGDERLRSLLSDSLMHQAVLRLVISHQANERVVQASEASGTVDIVLGGHTHGGQMALPFLNKLWNPSTLETPYEAGNYRVGDVFVNVNVGLGFTLTPVRYHVPAEVSVIDVIY